MKITVIMASFLSIPGRDKLEAKFRRAVKSFLKQTHQDKELIIIADGCEKTIQIYSQEFSSYDNIKLIPIPKQPFYSGTMRNIAFQDSDGDIIRYLDADDVLGRNDLQIIADQFDLNLYDFVYFNDYLILDKDFSKSQIRYVEPRWGSIGTSSICHKHPRLLKNGEFIKWGTGYSHDFIFTMKLASLGYRFKKLEKNPEYICCHYQGADY